MKKIIILRGNSGSGKTTIARALQKKFGYNTMSVIEKTNTCPNFHNVLDDFCMETSQSNKPVFHRRDLPYNHFHDWFFYS